MLEVVFIHAPFSLWHGFSVVLLFLSGFSAFGVDASHHKAGIATDILVFVALLLLEATAAGYALHANGDLVGAAVISAALLAIFQHQTISHANKVSSAWDFSFLLDTLAYAMIVVPIPLHAVHSLQCLGLLHHQSGRCCPSCDRHNPGT